MNGELGLENWLALGFVFLGVMAAVLWSGYAAEQSLKNGRKPSPPAE